MSKVEGTELLIPPMWCCTDNAAMIGASGQIAYNHKCFGDLDAAALCGITIPEEYLSQATYIIQNGKLEEK